MILMLPIRIIETNATADNERAHLQQNAAEGAAIANEAGATARGQSVSDLHGR